MDADTVGSCFIKAARISSGLASSPQAHRASPALLVPSLFARTIRMYTTYIPCMQHQPCICRLRRRCQLRTAQAGSSEQFFKYFELAAYATRVKKD